MHNPDIDKAYVSPHDKFLYQFDNDHNKSASQLKEIEKHQHIAKLRDDPNAQIVTETIWRDF